MLILAVLLGFQIFLPTGAIEAGRLTPAEEAAYLEELRQDIAARGADFEIGPNTYTNIPWEEFREGYLGLRLPEGLEPHAIIDDHGVNDRDLPSYYDWREHHAVAGVRNQSSCGSCWCFSAAGAFESAIMMSEGFEVDVSEQHAMACNTGGSGCSGGWMQDAYDVWQGYGGIAEEDMPYEARDDLPCPGSTYPAIVKLGSYYDVGYSVSDIKNAIYYHGPVSATMMVYPDLVPYQGGCYYHECPGELNHAILLVGWDDSYCDGQGAWIMKNSWGEEWGVAGYGMIRYDAACIGDYATYVTYQPYASLLGINHTPLEDTENTLDAYEVRAEIICTGGSVDLPNCYTYYRINNGLWEKAYFTATGSPDEYHVFIPAQPAGTKVEYYLHAEDTAGNSKTVPIWAPDDTYLFIVGSFETAHFEDFETSPGWTIGAPGDDATTGVWEWTDPQGTYYDGYMVQCEDDYTAAPGHNCYVTDGRAGSGAGDYDVDGGTTTLLSPVFDLSDYELVVVDYQRWYTNRRGSNPYADYWEVSVRSGSSDWEKIEYQDHAREHWSHQVHIVNDYVELGAEVQFRFAASDTGGGSLVEAAVDDFLLKGIRGESASVPGAEHQVTRKEGFLLASPNPFTGRTTVSFRLRTKGEASLSVYDCTGRLVRTLHQGSTEAGWHDLAWDDLGGDGEPLAAGVYFARFHAEGSTRTEKLVIMR